MTKPLTLFEKVWNAHVVAQEPEQPAILYIDLHLIHEVTSPQAFSGLRARNLKVRRRENSFATIDHSIPTTTPNITGGDQLAARQMEQLENNLSRFWDSTLRRE